ncbi:MAG: PD40 domain-containing protein [Acidobacteria bacterium]|nr:PD40 domain-containing protein [Acidobacteriota bacterium]
MWLMCLLLFQEPVNTELFAVDWDSSAGEAKVETLKRLTFKPGYDNQPSFMGDWVLFTSDRNKGQTDVFKVHAKTGKTKCVAEFSTGEYSPRLSADGHSFWCVRVEPDSTQRIWTVDLKSKKDKVLFPESKGIGYYLPLPNQEVIAFVLGEPNHLDLITPTGQTVIAENIGRGMQADPNGSGFAFLLKEGESGSIRRYENGKHYAWAPALGQSEDFLWTPQNHLIMGDGAQLFRWNDKMGWRPCGDFSKSQLTNISRLALSADASRLVFVAEVP